MASLTRSFSSILPVLAIAALLVGCNSNEENEAAKPAPVRPVKTVVVKPTTFQLQRTYSAIVLPSQEVELSFRVSGRILELPIRSGQEVKKDDVIAQLDKRDFEAEITRVESQLEQAESQMSVLTSGARAEDIASLEAAVAAAQAQVQAARDRMERSQELFKRKIVSKAKVEEDETSLRVAQAELRAKEQDLIKGKAGARTEDVVAQQAVIRGLKSQLKSLNDNLSDATLKAPFDGIIATRKVDNFSNIQAKEPVATLQTLSTLNLAFDVPGPDVAKFASAADRLDLKVVLDSVPDRVFPATQSEFSTQADPATQTYRGRVAIQNLNGTTILPGMTGNLTVTKPEEGNSVFLIPLSAVSSEANGNPFVWIVSDGDDKTSKRSVVTGQASGANIAISDGLAEGDRVVTAGLSALQDGMVVKPVAAIGD